MAESNRDEIVLDGLERVSQAAAFLGVSRSQIYKLINAGVLPSVRIGTSRRLILDSVSSGPKRESAQPN